MDTEMIRPLGRLCALALVVGGVAAAAAACGSSKGGDATPQTPPGTPPPDEPGGPPPPSGGFGDAGQLDVSTDTGDAACAESEATAKKANRPVDIILIIDNSSSMGDEIATIENQISTNLTSIIEAAKIDYRVIAVTGYGVHGPPSSSEQRMCIRSPLSGSTCSPVPALPSETTKFFHHSILVGSNDLWCAAIDGLTQADEFGLHPNGYLPLLRPGSFKVYIGVTDDRVSATCAHTGKIDDLSSAAGGISAADTLDSAFLNQHPTLYGIKTDRLYTWHSIVGVTDFNPANTAAPWPPSAAITTNKCGTAFDTGTGYQALSITTGGLRYPSCASDYSAVFNAIASSSISGAALDCDFEIPPPPAGQTLDLATVVPQFTPSDGSPPTNFQQVTSSAACASDKFYIADGKIHLCPDTCTKVQSDTGGAQIKILYGCDPTQLPGAH
jgi:hypothetical protein